MQCPSANFKCALQHFHYFRSAYHQHETCGGSTAIRRRMQPRGHIQHLKQKKTDREEGKEHEKRGTKKQQFQQRLTCSTTMCKCVLQNMGLTILGRPTAVRMLCNCKTWRSHSFFRMLVVTNVLKDCTVPSTGWSNPAWVAVWQGTPTGVVVTWAGSGWVWSLHY